MSLALIARSKFKVFPIINKHLLANSLMLSRNKEETRVVILNSFGQEIVNKSNQRVLFTVSILLASVGAFTFSKRQHMQQNLHNNDKISFILHDLSINILNPTMSFGQDTQCFYFIYSLPQTHQTIELELEVHCCTFPREQFSH